MPKSGTNPLGEDFPVRKVEWLTWLFEGTPIHWHLYAVDDNCPDHSAELAESIARDNGFADRVTVLKLRDGLPYSTPPLNRLSSLDESVKGGAIAFGVIAAAQDGYDYIGFTDCDNSIHVAHFGSCIGIAVQENAVAVSGERLSDGGFIF